MSRRLLLAILACAFIGTPASAQMYEGQKLVTPSLVADTDGIVPGKPFTVGLLLKMAPDWHTYWQYPGDAGFPTKIEWQLPRGFKAGEIQWPIPEKQNDEGDLQTFIYKDEVLLMVEITPPANLEMKQTTLAAKASWLVCKQICVPGNADLSVTLPVAAANQPANADLFSKYRERLPDFGAMLSQKWEISADQIKLQVFGLLHAGPVDFYPIPGKDLTIDHVQSPAANDNTDSPSFVIPITSKLKTPASLQGVLVATRPDGSRHGWLLGKVPGLQSGPTPATKADLLRFLVLGFFGGMLLNIMPCVLPVITLKIYGFMNQARQSRRRILHLGLAYCAGVFAWFLALATLIVTLGVSWSFQFQNQGFVGAMLVICLLFGLNLLGVFEVTLPGGLNTKISGFASKEGLGGAFLHGLFATLMGSACTAPLLGPAIGFALSQPPVIIFSFFTTIAAGMALPYFLLTLNPGWMHFLPKPGMWMVRIKQVMGVLVIATAAWFGYVLYQQIAVKRPPFAPMLQTALKSGRPVFVDFTADWCINCKVNERLVLKSAAVQEAFKKDNVLLLAADWTNGDPDITKLLKQYGRAGVPDYVIFPAGSSDQPIVLSELLTQQIVLDGLKQAKEKSK